jgi:hypothetical protein
LASASWRCERFRAALERLHMWRRRRGAALEWARATAAASEAGSPTFNAAASSPGLLFTNGGSTVSNTAAERAGGFQLKHVAVGSTGFPLHGRHSWAFRIDKDRHGDETVALGWTVLPVRDTGYDISQDMHTVRAYNAQVYGRAASRRAPAIEHGPMRVGAVAKFFLDGEARTVSLAVNGAWQGVIWALPSDEELAASARAAAEAAGRGHLPLPRPRIFPCVALYGGGRAVSVERRREQVAHLRPQRLESFGKYGR